MSHDPIRFRLTINLIIFLAVLVVGTIVFMLVENRSLIDAFYYIIVTMATVGYGDIVPATIPGACGVRGRSSSRRRIKSPADGTPWRRKSGPGAGRPRRRR